MAKPELGTKRLCPNCGAKYYDLNRDPILCPKCNAAFATGQVAARVAAPSDDDDDELETDDASVELVALEEADEGAADADTEADDIDGADDVEVDVEADDAALIDDDDDEVSDVVRPAGEDDDEDR